MQQRSNSQQPPEEKSVGIDYANTTVTIGLSVKTSLKLIKYLTTDHLISASTHHFTDLQAPYGWHEARRRTIADILQPLSATTGLEPALHANGCHLAVNHSIAVSGQTVKLRKDLTRLRKNHSTVPSADQHTKECQHKKCRIVHAIPHL